MDLTEDFSQLAAEHSALDTQLQKLHEKRFLTPEEEMETVRLKKLKLQVKDAMYSRAMIRT